MKAIDAPLLMAITPILWWRCVDGWRCKGLGRWPQWQGAVFSPYGVSYWQVCRLAGLKLALGKAPKDELPTEWVNSE